MESLRSFVIVLFGLSINILVSILVMIYGWGLSVRSWWWVIGIYLIGHIFGYAIVKLAENKKAIK